MKYITDIWNEIVTWCHAGIDPTPDIEVINYGALYNWYAATDARNICSAGWHIPLSAETYILSLFIDPDYMVVGGKLKEIGFTYWNSPNTGASNEVGFNGRGGGLRVAISGSFFSVKNQLIFWNSNEQPPNDAEWSGMWADDANFETTGGSMSTSEDKKAGLSIRPIKDSTTLAHGQTGTYTDPSGYTYRTICIGTQEWVADNVKTEHYRNGDPIPIITDNGAWAVLATDGMCYYNNDISKA